MDLDREILEQRMRNYFDPRWDWETVQSMIGSLAENAASYDAKKTRERLLREEYYESERLRRYALRPFDTVWCYYSSVGSLWNRPRPSYYAQCWKGNAFFMTRPAGVAYPEGIPVSFVSVLGDNDYQRGHSYYFPILLRENTDDGNGKNNHQSSVFEHIDETENSRANLSQASRKYLVKIGIRDPDANVENASLIWMHALAIGYSPTYLEENADGIRQDWPRIPLPATKEALLASAELGRRVAALLDTEKPVDGVTCGKIDPRLKTIGVIRKVFAIGTNQLNPDAGDLDLTVGWGRAGRNGVCMPSCGKTVARNQQDPALKQALGVETLDIYLNDDAYWENIPTPVWDYTVGGYQVIKKWLSYREKAILGRGLTIEEADYVTEMARRIAALILLQPELNANYEAMKSDTWPWPENENNDW